MTRIQLYDTTLRDGAQGEGISFSVEDKLKIAQRLDQMGFDYIEGGWPGSNPKDNEFFQKAKDIQWEHGKLSAFGSTRRAGTKACEDRNLQTILATKVKVAAIVGKAWDFQVTNALQTTLEENLAMVAESIAFLCSHGLEVIFDAEHYFDGYKANPSYALEVLQAAAEAGASVVVLCDTNGGTLPWEIDAATRAVVESLGVRVGVHIHNDAGLAVASSLVAVNAGATHVQGTINGYGERCGNADLCSVIPNLQLKAGKECLTKENLGQLTRLSNFVSELANQIPDDKQPFVGRSVFSHKGGLHVSALDNALRKALEEAYPRLQNIWLTDYKVRVLNERRGTGAKVRVLIESTDGVQTWGTVGVSHNLIEPRRENPGIHSGDERRTSV